MTRTKGDVIVEEIRIGDIIYHYKNGEGSMLKITRRPYFNGEYWVIKYTDLKTKRVGFFFIYNDDIGPEIYTYKKYGDIF